MEWGEKRSNDGTEGDEHQPKQHKASETGPETAAFPQTRRVIMRFRWELGVASLLGFFSRGRFLCFSSVFFSLSLLERVRWTGIAS